VWLSIRFSKSGRRPLRRLRKKGILAFGIQTKRGRAAQGSGFLGAETPNNIVKGEGRRIWSLGVSEKKKKNALQILWGGRLGGSASEISGS